MKNQIDILDVSPSKRIYKSIIADYSLNLALSELIDNAIDIHRKRAAKEKSVSIAIELNTAQQVITVADNAGGVPKDALKNIVSPGHTGNDASENIIGLFGVGSKRAVVAIAQDVLIKSRNSNEPTTHQIEYDDAWLEDEEWELPIFSVTPIQPGTTIVELKRLRRRLEEFHIAVIKNELQATYAYFLSDSNISISVNDEKLTPIFFDRNWSYNPEYPPQEIKGSVKVEGKTVNYTLLGGLIREGGSAGYGEYGFYAYCNDRLIARHYRDEEVGFRTGEAGIPHGTISHARVILMLRGAASLMPWNSSKSNLDFKHPLFEHLQPHIREAMTFYSRLSRTFYNSREENLYPYQVGKVKTIEAKTVSEISRIFDAPLPVSRPRYIDKIKKANSLLGQQKPWTVGLFEAMVAVDTIFRQKKLTQKNRIALVVLDSNLEIAFKEYLLNESGVSYSDEVIQKLFRNRKDVISEVKKQLVNQKIAISKSDWNRIDHFYRMRCDLIHRRATSAISNEEIEAFSNVVQSVLQKLFKIKFK